MVGQRPDRLCMSPPSITTSASSNCSSVGFGPSPIPKESANSRQPSFSIAGVITKLSGTEFTLIALSLSSQGQKYLRLFLQLVWWAKHAHVRQASDQVHGDKS